MAEMSTMQKLACVCFGEANSQCGLAELGTQQTEANEQGLGGFGCGSGRQAKQKTKIMRSRIFGIVMCFLGLFTSGCSGAGGNHLVRPEENGEWTWSALERSSVQFAHINWANASAPFERYLLIKDGQFLCAVRFIDYWRGRDARAGSFWSSGEETLSSKYEWDLLDVSDVEMTVKSHGTGVVKFTAPWGLGHLILGGGYENIKCAGRDFGWQYPGAVNFSQKAKSEMMLAPSRWTRIEDIRLSDPRLVWYSFDEHRKDKKVPVGDL